MPHSESSRPFNSRGCTQPKYSPLPASDDTPTMSLKNKFIALKSRSTEQTTRIDSPPNMNIEEDVVVDDGTVYRVYKKRWIGVAIIMLLNIVSAWRYVSLEGVRLTRVSCSWIAFAPVAGLTRDYFGLASTTPVNWLSTVVLFVYCIVSPLTMYVYHHHGVRTGVTTS